MANIPKIQKALYPHIPKIDPSIQYPLKYLQKYPVSLYPCIPKTLPGPRKCKSSCYAEKKNFSVRLSELFDSSLTWSETPKLEPRRQISRQGPVNQNQDDFFILGRMCGSRRGGGWTGGHDPPPP